eukprot:scaffold867_cov317-Pavlova_lutheri.AAC.69
MARHVTVPASPHTKGIPWSSQPSLLQAQDPQILCGKKSTIREDATFERDDTRRWLARHGDMSEYMDE